MLNNGQSYDGIKVLAGRRKFSNKAMRREQLPRNRHGGRVDLYSEVPVGLYQLG
nr:hypothetical protein [Saliniramus fredricksonii]